MTFLNQASASSRRIHGIRGVVSATCLFALGFAAGCEDSAAQHRAEAQRTITTASAEFRKATAGAVAFGDEHFEQRKRELNAVISRVSNLSNAEPGQQAAGGMLAAEALDELAAMHLAHAQQIQQVNRQDRRSIESLVDATARLHAQAQAQAAVTTSAERASLQGERQAAEAALADLQRRITALEGPIGARTRSNAAGEAEADRLRAEANDLIRRAIELGHASGFPSYQQAISTRRDADGIDYEIAMRELELDYELHPEHDLAKLQVEHLNQSVQSIRETLDEFDRLEQLFASDLSKTRQRVSEMQQNVAQSLRSLTERIDGELSEHFDAARSHLERAAAQAGQAVSRLRGDQAGAARLLQAKVRETLGQSLWSEASAIAEHLILLSQIIEAGESTGNTAEHQSTFESLTAKRQRLIEEARAAFDEAEQALSGVTGRAADAVASFRQNLQRASSAMSGQPLGPAPAAPGSDRSRGSAGAASGGMQGFSTPQDAVAFLGSFDPSNRSHADRLFAAVDTTTPNGAAVVHMMRSVMNAALELEEAVRDTFGDVDSDLGMGATQFDNPRIDYEDGSRVTIAYDTMMGEESIDLVNPNGQWLIDSTSISSSMPGMDQLDPATLRKMGDAMAGAFAGLTGRVRNGEFSSKQELEQALAQTMMQVMMQAFGQ